jgi:hypothetical protein
MSMDYDDESPAMPVNRILSGIASALALVLIGFGLWALGGAIYFAWGLFRDPDGIAYFARYFLETTKIAAHLPGSGEGLAHYVSWVAVVLLLLVLGKLGAWAVAAGAQLLQPRGTVRR